MSPSISGIHHITALASDPQANLSFYTETLGLRLVKRTVNFDDPGTYHLYYGDETGSPGTILTFFPWPGARRGSRGVGQATVTAFSVPTGSLGFWQERFAARGVPHEAPHPRFEEEVLTFLDPDGLKLELVAHAGAEERVPWSGGGVAERHAVRGFFGTTLLQRNLAPTAEVLTTGMGLTAVATAGQRSRYAAAAGRAGSVVDLLLRPDGERGRIAAGTVHHVAFRVADDAAQGEMQGHLETLGILTTEVKDRQYFRSIYFREPGGVLFEVATDSPGFAIDEPVATLGQALQLPPWLEAQRTRIEPALPPLTLHTEPVATAGAR